MKIEDIGKKTIERKEERWPARDKRRKMATREERGMSMLEMI